MARTTITVDSDTVLRLSYYKSVFGYSSMDDVIREIMNKLGMASVEDIKRLRQLQNREGRE